MYFTFDKIKKSPIFNNISDSEIKELLECFCAYEKKFSSGETIMSEGDVVKNIGLVAEGKIHLVRMDYSGNKTIINELSDGALFAEAYAFGESSKNILPVSVYAETACTVLFFDSQKITDVCSLTCRRHVQFIKNLLFLSAESNIMLSRRLGHLSKRSTADKLMSYFYEQAFLNGSKSFTVPFNRQQLADYLCVERSAMSTVLSELKKSGKIDFCKNKFVLLDFSDKY